MDCDLFRVDWLGGIHDALIMLPSWFEFLLLGPTEGNAIAFGLHVESEPGCAGASAAER